MRRGSFRSFLRTPRGRLTGAVGMGVACVWLLAATAGPAGGPGSPTVVAGCLLGLALWPLVLTAGTLAQRYGRGRAATVAILLTFAVLAFVPPVALSDSLPILAEPVPAGRFTYRETYDPGVALGTIALASSFVIPSVVAAVRFRSPEPAPLARDRLAHPRAGAALGLVGLTLLAASLLVVGASKARDEAGIRRAFEAVADGLWAGPPAAVAPLLSYAADPDPAALAAIECLRSRGPRRPAVGGIERFAGRGGTSALVTAAVGDEGPIVEVDMVRSGGAGAPWRTTHVSVLACDPG